MVETFNKMKIFQKGIISVIALLALGMLLLLGSYFLTFALTESRISESQGVATKTYYLAEAGINEAIWKIKNNETTKNNFLNGTLTSTDDINKDNVFGDNKASYSVAVVSTAPAEANIIATSTYQIAEWQSQRVVRIYIVKATGSGVDWEFAMFSGVKGKEDEGKIEISGSSANITINGGRFHANNDIELSGSQGTLIVNDGAVTASDNIEVTGSDSQIILNNSYQEAPVPMVDTPAIDFDAWANRATATYTSSQFEDLPNDTVLTGIIYVNRKIKLSESDYNLTINGVLIVNGSFELSGSNITLTVNYDAGYGGGVLVNGKLEVTSDICLTVDGLIYVSKNLEISGSGVVFTSTGAVIAGNIETSGSGLIANITYKPEYFQTALDPELNPDSPIIQIDHWEEEY